jgi:hypothetical protein
MGNSATPMHQSYRNHTTIAEPLRNPFSHLPLSRPASDVLPWTAAQSAQFCLSRDRNNLAAAEQNYAACAALGLATAASAQCVATGRHRRSAPSTPAASSFVGPGLPLRRHSFIRRLPPRRPRPEGDCRADR